MNTTLLKLIAIIILAIIALRFNVVDSIFALIFLGMIPGTDMSISPVIMMLVYPVAIIGAIYWLTRQPLYIGSQEKQQKTARAVARKRVAKKTSAKKPRRQYRKAEAKS